MPDAQSPSLRLATILSQSNAPRDRPLPLSNALPMPGYQLFRRLAHSLKTLFCHGERRGSSLQIQGLDARRALHRLLIRQAPTSVVAGMELGDRKSVV